MRKRIERAGSQQAWARQVGISPQYLCDVLMARRDVPDKVLAALGYVRVVTYRRAKAS
jgi:hypothetical protein